ncbi:hypothetical protein JL720_17133 [Aureococcus anophagefferens]|nr:hypothetical protein JL720_17133 [Aureococcus anophagefferens]
MKLFVSYKEGEDEAHHMATKFTVPKGWRPGPVAKLLGFSVDTYNAKHKDHLLNVDEVLKTKDEVFIAPDAERRATPRRPRADAERKAAEEAEAKRVFAIGKAGPAPSSSGPRARKSTLLNKLCGYKCAPDANEQFAWDREPPSAVRQLNDPYANRLNPATYTILKMLDEKFRDASSSVWKHVVFAYSRCDEESRGWKTNMEPYCGEGKKGKRSEMAATIRAKFGLPANVKDVPCSASAAPRRPARPPDFAALWEAIEDAAPLDTTKIKPFEHVADKIKSSSTSGTRRCSLEAHGPTSSAARLLWADHGRARYRKLEAAARSAFAGAAPKKKNE